MINELILYADESVKKGKYYSYFYGGCLVNSKNLNLIVDRLNSKKSELNIFSELKWQKVTSQYLDKYQEIVSIFFDLVRDDYIKFRVMFLQNSIKPLSLNEYSKEYGYFLLYYQFIKHAFGLRYIPHQKSPVYLRVYFDKLPDTREKATIFKSHISALSKSAEFRRVRIIVKEDQVAEVDSKKHILMQCTDIVLGAMQFRLNNLHKYKPEGARIRGQRTIAKEKLYKFICKRIRELYPNFNIGITTGIQGEYENRWKHPYRHWSFKPIKSEIDNSKTKKKAP